ncbi:HNH endonuclease [Mycobacterium sp. 21AC1]|nr:HNH endonuclease [Mycobacterium sp. 21AC1]
MVLPGGLGDAQHTSGGQVVYPDVGAGFDMLAENTATGTRTIARIKGPGGVRMVTTFVRTPVDTVMLAHTNGYLTVNKATPAAETVGMFSPAETRDTAGKLVPSSYVVKQLAPQLYALAEVIDPQPGTAWPVYVDPPLHLTGAGGAPLGLFDSVTNTVSSVANTVTAAASTALSATASGAKAVGGFVKENPLESAMLVGGVALALTGVGGPASAAMIASATVNLASASVDVAAAALPDNQALGMASTVLGAASMVTPQGAARKAVTEGTELAAEQLAQHADEIVDVAKAAPTPPAQLADDIPATAATKPPVTPGVSPKTPNAPPTAKAPDAPTGSGPALPVPDVKPKPTGKTISPPVKDKVTADRVSKSPDGNLRCENPHCAQRVYRQEGRTRTGDKIPPNRAQFDHKDTPKSRGGTGGENGEDTQILCRRCNGPAGKGDKRPDEWAAAQEDIGRDSRRIIQRHIREHGEPPDGVIHSPNLRPQAAVRNGQARATTQATAAQHRDTAVSTARGTNNASAQSNASSTASTKSQDGGKKNDKKKPSKKKKKKDKKKTRRANSTTKNPSNR